METSHTRWRLILGKTDEEQEQYSLSEREIEMDEVLTELYDKDRRGGLGSSNPKVNRWLGDIRKYFPSSVVEVMQRDALERLQLDRMLTEPELLSSLTPNVHLAAKLLSLQSVIPEETADTARQVVDKVVVDIEKKLKESMRTRINAMLKVRRSRSGSKPHTIDWKRTIHANLKHYQPSEKTIIPEKLIGYSGHKHGLEHIILLVDQSGSMAESLVYSAVIGSILASLTALRTRFVAFDTEIADLTDKLYDPVSLLFGVQLGGGTDIHKAVSYAETLITTPAKTTVVLISDLYEGGSPQGMLSVLQRIRQQGTRVLVLPALDDNGKPSYDKEVAKHITSIDIPVFSCTPDLFADKLIEAMGS